MASKRYFHCSVLDYYTNISSSHNDDFIVLLFGLDLDDLRQANRSKISVTEVRSTKNDGYINSNARFVTHCNRKNFQWHSYRSDGLTKKTSTIFRFERLDCTTIIKTNIIWIHTDCLLCRVIVSCVGYVSCLHVNDFEQKKIPPHYFSFDERYFSGEPN